MSTIRCIYEAEPDFPATDQHPFAERFKVGRHWVDAIGVPTQAEVDAMLRPPPPPKDAQPLTAAETLALVNQGRGRALTSADLPARVRP